MRALRRPRQQRTVALTLVVAGALLMGSATSGTAAAPATSTSTAAVSSLTSVVVATEVSAAAATPAVAETRRVSATSSTDTETTPAPSPAPDDAEDASPGLPWTGIVVGGVLGLAAGIVLMVLSKRRERRD
jgi:hypothetical protein